MKTDVSYSHAYACVHVLPSFVGTHCHNCMCMHSYWTDNGACYYYTTGSKYTNYEDLLVAVKKDADDNGIPFRYVQVCSLGPLYYNYSVNPLYA